MWAPKLLPQRDLAVWGSKYFRAQTAPRPPFFAEKLTKLVAFFYLVCQTYSLKLLHNFIAISKVIDRVTTIFSNSIQLTSW